MKSIIFVLLIYYSFCQIYELEKYGTIETKLQNGLVYLNTEDFLVGDTVHIQFNAVNGYMNQKIYYQFYFTKPNSTFIPSKSMRATSRASTETNILGKTTITEKYYYDIKKGEDGKYLIISYSGFYSRYANAYLEIEHTRVNWNTVLLIIIFSVVGLIFIIIFTVILIKNIKKCKSRNVNDYQPMQSSYIPPSSTTPQNTQPSQPNQSTTGYDSTTFNNYPQQQNIYYEPQQRTINY